MTDSQHPTSPGRRHGVKLRGLMSAVLAAVMLLVVSVTAPSAHAAARVTVANEFGKAQADTTYSTTLEISGRGFQSVKGGFGGIYVMFGWVNAKKWRPSQGGSSGSGDILYVPDSSTKRNSGFQKYVAFPGASTASDANGGTIAADGTWQTTIVVPGPKFQAVGSGGAVTEVNCRKVTCGIITIGAHGVVNKNNESFTPVEFANIYADESIGNDDSKSATPNGSESDSGASDPSDQSTSPARGSNSQTADSAAPTAEQPATPEPVADAAGEADEPQQDDAGIARAEGDSPADARPASIKVDSSTAIEGRVLAFTAQGFLEGEQVVVVLDEGVAAVGPLIVGRDGALAGVLALPEQVTKGTHTLTVTAAASGRSATVNFPVRADSTVEPAVPVVTPSDGADGPAPWVLVLAAIAVLLFLAAVVLRVRSRRARRPSVGQSAASGTLAEGREPPAPDAATATEWEPIDRSASVRPATRTGTTAVLVLLVGIVVLPSLAIPRAAAESLSGDDAVDPIESQTIAVTDAQLRWSLNTEVGAGAYNGSCNFLSAGKAGDAGGSFVWDQPGSLYKAKSGAVTVEKPDANGRYVEASWATRCLDPHGTVVNVANHESATGNQVVITGGAGEVDPVTGAGTISWTGSFTVVMYGGMTYWSASDPYLVVNDDGQGDLRATVSGFSANQEGTAAWGSLAPREVSLSGVGSIEDLTDAGFTARTTYLGQSAGVSEQVAKTDANRAYWGSFPQDFVQFQMLTGQSAYWFTSTGIRNATKIAAPVHISYTPAEAVTEVPPSNSTKNPPPVNTVSKPPKPKKKTATKTSTKTSTKKSSGKNDTQKDSDASRGADGGTGVKPPVTAIAPEPPTVTSPPPPTDAVQGDAVPAYPLVGVPVSTTVSRSPMLVAESVSAALPVNAGVNRGSTRLWLAASAALLAAACAILPWPRPRRRSAPRL